MSTQNVVSSELKALDQKLYKTCVFDGPFNFDLDAKWYLIDIGLINHSRTYSLEIGFRILEARVTFSYIFVWQYRF